MSISTIAVVQGGVVTIPVGNVLPDGKQVNVTIAEAVPTIPGNEEEMDVEQDVYIQMTPDRQPMGKAKLRVVNAQPNMVGIGSDT